MNGLILAAVIMTNANMSIMNADFSTLSDVEISDFRVECKARGMTTMETHARNDEIYRMKCWKNETTGMPS